jgi:hypothetical protein
LGPDSFAACTDDVLRYLVDQHDLGCQPLPDDSVNFFHLCIHAPVRLGEALFREGCEFGAHAVLLLEKSNYRNAAEGGCLVADLATATGVRGFFQLQCAVVPRVALRLAAQSKKFN